MAEKIKLMKIIYFFNLFSVSIVAAKRPLSISVGNQLSIHENLGHFQLVGTPNLGFPFNIQLARTMFISVQGKDSDLIKYRVFLIYT